MDYAINGWLQAHIPFYCILHVKGAKVGTQTRVLTGIMCMQLYSADPLCKGEDWVAINNLDDIDIASVHIYTEFWPVCTK